MSSGGILNEWQRDTVLRLLKQEIDLKWQNCDFEAGEREQLEELVWLIEALSVE